MDTIQTARLIEENNKLKEALQFYADRNNYVDNDYSCGDPECCGYPSPSFNVVNDDGKQAREALGEK
jgi:hypothetical protein